jgi:hypothetical protein
MFIASNTLPSKLFEFFLRSQSLRTFAGGRLPSVSDSFQQSRIIGKRFLQFRNDSFPLRCDLVEHHSAVEIFVPSVCSIVAGKHGFACFRFLWIVESREEDNNDMMTCLRIAPVFEQVEREAVNLQQSLLLLL